MTTSFISPTQIQVDEDAARKADSTLQNSRKPSKMWMADLASLSLSFGRLALSNRSDAATTPGDGRGRLMRGKLPLAVREMHSPATRLRSAEHGAMYRFGIVAGSPRHPSFKKR